MDPINEAYQQAIIAEAVKPGQIIISKDRVLLMTVGDRGNLSNVLIKPGIKLKVIKVGKNIEVEPVSNVDSLNKKSQIWINSQDIRNFK
jgi:hypothetical protein